MTTPPEHLAGDIRRARRPRSRAADPGPPPARAVFFFLCLVLLAGAGCRLAETAVKAPGQAIRAVTTEGKAERVVDPVVVQQTLLRFADEYSTLMIIGLDKLREGTNALSQAEVLEWKIAFVTETCAIVSGPNAVADLLDMTIFVTASRMALEEHWRPEVLGDSVRPLLENCRSAETGIWLLADKVLTPAQQQELRQAIEAWHQQNPLLEKVLAARLLGFAAQVKVAGHADEARPGSMFTLFNVDPLAGMDPAVRQLAQARLFAERGLFVTQKLPMLLRWQTELLSLNAMAQPPVQQLVTNSTQIAASVDRFSRMAEKLPGQITAEREEILKALQAQESTLTPLVGEVRQTIAAGTAMSASLNTTLVTFDALMKRFGIGESNLTDQPKPGAAPFRVLDYAQTATQLEAMARQLTELLGTFDRTLGSTNLLNLAAQAGPVVRQAQAGGQELVDYAFWRGLLLLAIMLMAALGYRLLAIRLARPAAPGEK